MKKYLALTAVAIALLFLFPGCPEKDTTTPTVKITEPANNATLTAGNITIKAVATDDKEMSKVEFWVDGAKKGEDNSPTDDTLYSYTWDASSAASGAHKIVAKAFDKSDNTASDSITITITGGGGGGGTIHDGGAITSDETWSPVGNPHIIRGDISVENNATLTILPGCIIKFYPDVELYAGYDGPGAIIANGTPDSTILFTSNVTTPAPGDWLNVGLYQYAMNTSSFRYCIFEYGGKSTSYPGLFYADGITFVKIANCTFRYSGNYGVYLTDDAGFNTFTNNTITNCNQYPLRINAEYVRTIGTGNNFTGNTINAILVRGGTIHTSGTWVNPGVPYVIESDVDIGDNNTNPVITIAPGNVIKFQPDVEMYAGYSGAGGLIADGTSGRIRFTSYVASPSPGDWYNIGFYEYSIDASSKLINCTIEYGGGSSSCPGNIYIDDAVPEIVGDSIGHSANWGIYLEGTQYPNPTQLVNDNFFYDCPSGAVRIP
uniref:Right handed beta helix domain-containing protein n=1 Tax=candidate division WOR-3 bacterium TaxID=2052148 RepID=A0A7C6EDW4_UNCW3